MNASFVDTLGEKMLKSILKRRSVLLPNYYTIIRYCYYYMLEVVGTRKNGHARGRHARPFSLSPTTSKRLLCRLGDLVLKNSGNVY